MDDRKKVKCPFCGYEMPIFYTPNAADCKGVYVKCKGRRCGHIFEILIRKEKIDK